MTFISIRRRWDKAAIWNFQNHLVNVEDDIDHKFCGVTFRLFSIILRQVFFI